MGDEFIDDDLIEVIEPSQAESRLAELRIRLDPSIAYRFDKMFPRLQGWGAKGELKKKGKQIRLLEPTLHKILRPGEEILYVAKGVQQSAFEAMFMGLMWAALMNQTVFVLTNARIIIIRTDSSGKPKPTCWMIYYSEIRKFKRSWLGSLVLNLNDGRKLTFGGFTKTDGATMPAIFEEALQTYRERGFQPATTQSQENLCSRCYECVPKGEYQCEQCGQQFWSPGQVALRSAIFPSWGDFLMGHAGLACFELVGYIFTAIGLLIVIVAALQGVQPIEAVLFAMMSLAVVHGFDAFITYFVARKGLHPK